MESRDQYTVVLEDLRSQFKVFGEALHGVHAKLDGHDARFDRLELRADGTDGDLRFLRAAVTDHSGELRELRAGMARIEAALDKKVDRDEVKAMVAQGAGR